MGRLKQIEWKNPNKMEISTGHKTFDRQTNILSPGNIIANTLTGLHIRAYNDDGGRNLRPGELQDYDLRLFYALPYRAREIIREHLRNRSGWLYELYSYCNERRRIIHGYILTDYVHNLIRTFITGPTSKSRLVIEGTLPYLAIVGDNDENNKGNRTPR